MSASDLLLAATIMAMASTLQGAVGFGANLVAAPLLVMIDPSFAPGPLIVASLVLTGTMAIREPEGARLAELGWAYAGRVPGTLLGALALSLVARSNLELFFGILVLGAVAMSVGGLRLPANPGTLTSVGVLSGFMGTSVSVGGPPLALLYQHAGGPALRGTMARFLVVGSSFSLLVLALSGHFDSADLAPSAALAPGAFAGYLLAKPLKGPLDRRGTRIAVLVVSAASALALMATTLL